MVSHQFINFNIVYQKKNIHKYQLYSLHDNFFLVNFFDLSNLILVSFK